MKKLLTIALFICISFLGFSQKSKPTTSAKAVIAYVFEDYILQNLNDMKNLQAEVASKKVTFESKPEQKAQRYQEEYSIYQAMMKNITGLTTDSLNAKLKLVQELKKEVDDYQTKSEDDLRQLIQEKYLTIREKINATIKLVAAEKGYKFVFRRNPDGSNNESNTIMIYSADDGKDNISDAVLLKMGTTPPKK